MTKRVDEADDEAARQGAQRVYEALLARVGEANPQPRLDATRRALELLGDPHRAYPVVHLTGTNGKTTTSRIVESVLRAHGLRTGMMTSPHLVRVNERIAIDGEPISDAALVANWDDIEVYLEMVDAELRERDEEPLSYFEALTVLAFASFADAPVDVVVLEVGMGGEWDSTNVADGQVAVFTPIALDHTHRLGSTIAEIASTKAGIIKPGARVITALQHPDAQAELADRAASLGVPVAAKGVHFGLEETRVAVGGQQLTVQGLAGRYEELYLPLYGDHQAHNAAVAIAAVEAFLGDGTQAIDAAVLAEGFARVTSPGRLQLIGTEPTVLVDAAHNPHGALALADGIRRYFEFGELAIVLGILADKDAHGIVDALAPLAACLIVTQSSSDRAIPAGELGESAALWAGNPDLEVVEHLDEAIDLAREWAASETGRAVLVTGSITLVGEALALGEEEGWMR